MFSMKNRFINTNIHTIRRSYDLIFICSHTFISHSTRNVLKNISSAAIILNPILNLYDIKYRVENAQILDKDGPCVIVTKHQSFIDLIDKMNI